MRLTPCQLQTTTPKPPVTMVRCMGPYNAQNPVRPSAARPSVLLPQWMGVCDPTPPQTPSNSAVSWNVDACTILLWFRTSAPLLPQIVGLESRF